MNEWIIDLKQNFRSSQFIVNFSILCYHDFYVLQTIQTIHSKITMAGDVVPYYTVTARYLHWSNRAASLK